MVLCSAFSVFGTARSDKKSEIVLVVHQTSDNVQFSGYLFLWWDNISKTSTMEAFLTFMMVLMERSVYESSGSELSVLHAKWVSTARKRRWSFPVVRFKQFGLFDVSSVFIIWEYAYQCHSTSTNMALLLVLLLCKFRFSIFCLLLEFLVEPLYEWS